MKAIESAAVATRGESVLDDLDRGEQPLSMKQAGKSPLLSGPLDQATLYRYCERGLRGIKLEWAQLGCKRVTSPSAIRRFVERLTAVAAGEPVPTRSHRRRERDISAAERRLAKCGL